jgi:hypothetical protein
MVMLTENGEAIGRDSLLAGLHREHLLDVPAQGHQIPFTFDVFRLATIRTAVRRIGHHDRTTF